MNTEATESPDSLGSRTGSLPSGYERVRCGDLIQPGDLAVCIDGIRGPIPADWDGIGMPTTEYTKTAFDWMTPPVMFFARKIQAENTQSQAPADATPNTIE